AAELQGASLLYAQIRGSSLDKAQLQGANFDRSSVGLSSISGAFVWRTRGIRCDGSYVVAPHTQPVVELRPVNKPQPTGPPEQKDEEIAATPESVQAFIERVVSTLLEDHREIVRKKLSASLATAPGTDDSVTIKPSWQECADLAAATPGF